MSAARYPRLTDQQQFWNTWNARWRDPNALNQWSLRRGETILNIISSLTLDKPEILDLGCGTGWLTERLAHFGPTTGVDLADSVIAAAKARSPHIAFLAGDIFEVPLPAGHFDVVVSQEVIAHVTDQVAYLDRAADMLKPKGYLIITTPNKLVIDRGDWLPQPPEHIEQWLTMGRLRRLLRFRFRILRTMSILPMGHRGVLRLINSHKANAALGLLISQQCLDSFKEWAGLGYTLIVLAQRRS
jgi:2-polyprenyl-3-methyl-5-hydroxy-6-metoxy-1,4-benzoquinol methylase